MAEVDEFVTNHASRAAGNSFLASTTVALAPERGCQMAEADESVIHEVSLQSSSWWDAGSWLSGASQAWNDAGTIVSAAVGVGSTTITTPEELADFSCLSEWPSERDVMLRLRERAVTRAPEAAGNALENGLRRLRTWAENVTWAPNGTADSARDRASWGDVSPRWKRLGFQSNDPRTDFRTGIIALDNLVSLCECSADSAELMIKEAGAAALDYPFAVASINVTQILAWYLSLVQGPNPAGLATAVAPLADKQQLCAFARLCKDGGFDELHYVSMVRLHLTWQRMKAADPSINVFAFAQALQEMLAVVDEILRSVPLESISDLHRIRDAPAPAGWLSSVAVSLGMK